ncbi:hypothetical protein FO519_006667 [Halicephalobus sp. NKZ332]|nr:hypothetical protein FO519_006667 [Halicephalobus sp. NKZ332]
MGKEVPLDEVSEIKLLIDFDSKAVFLNTNRIPYYNADLEKADDSLNLVLGGSGLFLGCIEINELVISGEKVRLEEATSSETCHPADKFLGTIDKVDTGDLENKISEQNQEEGKKDEENQENGNEEKEKDEENQENGNKEEEKKKDEENDEEITEDGEDDENNTENNDVNGEKEGNEDEEKYEYGDDKEDKKDKENEQKEDEENKDKGETILEKEKELDEFNQEQESPDSKTEPPKEQIFNLEKDEQESLDSKTESQEEQVFNLEKDEQESPDSKTESQEEQLVELGKDEQESPDSKTESPNKQIFNPEKDNQDVVDKKVNELVDQPGILEDSKNTTNLPNCLPDQRAQCGPDSKSCESNSGYDSFICNCKPGYAGRVCQFSLLPRSCYEAFSLNTGYVNEPGAYEIDVDGSGPLRSTWAYCNKDAVTVVEHNMPDSTVIRSSENFTDQYFPISYKLFPQMQLKTLIENSFNCQQNLKFDCRKTPLSFRSNLTWFEVATGKMIKQIGPDFDTCPCSKSGCLQNRKCNCDSLEETFDEGFLTGQNAGITTIFALKYSTEEGEGKFTLSPLKCEGNSGHHSGNSITLKSKRSTLDYSAEKEIEHLEFEFRTIEENIESLAHFETGNFSTTISLKNGHILSVMVIEDGTIPEETVIMSQAKLSDLRWHRILIEIISEEIRFSVDDINEFKILKKKGLPSNLRFGHNNPNSDSDGFIGCLRNVILNRKSVPITSFGKNIEGIFAESCPNLCLGHNCEQESKCIEHFDTGKRSCKCKNKFIHKGERCEKNLNTNSEVSFHDHRTGFLRYSNDELNSNPLESTIAFSVRTDQKQAVLIYVHDQSDNILQVHLADEYRIVLTVSNYTGDNKATISTCTVFSYKHAEFSDMRWLQIIVERTPERTTLSVDEEQCEIKGSIVLAPPDEKINDYDIEDREIIYPPRAAGNVKVLDPFQYLFVGGVKSQFTYDRKKRNSDFHDEQKGDLDNYHEEKGRYSRSMPKRKRSLDPLYTSVIPIFLGCMKGLVVGDQFVDMRQGGVRPKDPEAIQFGCYTDCDSATCHNGGHCTYVWENRDPRLRDLTSCDCSKTSYFGQNCLKDIGVTFDGSESILYQFSASHDYDLFYDRQQTFRFAFTPKTGVEQTQRIATAYFKDSSELQVTLHLNSSITVVYTRRPEEVHLFIGNFTDGYRHFFQATFAKKERIRIVIDSIKHYFEKGLDLHLSDIEKFRFGGVYENEELTDSYYGCLSNIDIDFHRNSKTIFQPLLYYLNSSSGKNQFLIDEPESDQKLPQATCGSFLVPGILPTFQRNVQFPLWEAVFFPVSFQSNFTPSNEDIGPEGGIPWWLWIIIGFILILLLLCCIFCCCRKKKQPPPIGSGARPEENYPLYKFSPPEDPIPTKQSPDSVSVNDNFEIPKPTENLFNNGTPGTRIPDRPSVSDPEYPEIPNKASLTSIYYTAQEYPDADSMDAYSQDDPDDIDKQLARGFGEERPNIMDKKTHNMLEKTSPQRTGSFERDDYPPRSPNKSLRQLTPAEIPRISTDYIGDV